MSPEKEQLNEAASPGESGATEPGEPGSAPDAEADEPRTPFSFLVAAIIFLLALFTSYGLTVTTSVGVDVVKECHYAKLDNLAGGAMMLTLAAIYALNSGKNIRKDVLHHSIFALVALGGLYLVYTVYQAWPEDCLSEIQYLFQRDNWS